MQNHIDLTCIVYLVNNRKITLVKAIAPRFGPYDVVACPAPIDPAITLIMPSTKIPLFIAWAGGGGISQILAHA